MQVAKFDPIALKSSLEAWLTQHDLETLSFSDCHAVDTGLFDAAPDAVLVMHIDGRLYDVFWGDDGARGYKGENKLLREQFDSLVEGHRAWYDFGDFSTILFMQAADPRDWSMPISWQ